MSTRTRIYTVFPSQGTFVRYDAYRKYHTDVHVPDNQEVLDDVKTASPQVEFLGSAAPEKPEVVAAKIREQKGKLDGLLVFGHTWEELLDFGLPVIAVSRPFIGCTTIPFAAYHGKRVVTCHLPSLPDRNPSVYRARFDDIATKVRLIDAIARMKNVRVLIVTDKPVLGYFEPEPIQIDTTREEFERVYLDNLKQTFGTEFVTVNQKTLFDRVNAADSTGANEIAERWMAEALTLRGTNAAQVVASAKLYLGMKELMEENKCTAITTEGFGYPPLGFEEAVRQGVPSQGMPTSQFLTDGIAAASETLTDCLLTQQLALFITGSGGLLGDYNIDCGNGTAVVAHCEGTFKPYGDERRTPYILRNLPFVPENTGGACAEALYPIGEQVTVAKLSVYRKKLSLFSGTTVSGQDLFPYWTDILGTNKVAIRTDANALLNNVDWATFGNHRTVFFGDHRQKFADLAKLIGYEVVEKDRW